MNGATNATARRLRWATMGALLLVLAAALPAFEAGAGGVGNPVRVFDVAITDVCRQLRAPRGVVVKVTNSGTIDAGSLAVTGGVVYPGLEYVDSVTKSVPVSPLRPGKSALVRFTGQEVGDRGRDGYRYFFAVENKGHDVDPGNNSREFASFAAIDPCPLRVKPRLDPK